MNQRAGQIEPETLIPWREYEGCPQMTDEGPCTCDRVDWSTP